MMQEIKRIRKEMGISQKEVAEKLNVTLKTYNLWEKTDTKRKKNVLQVFIRYEYKDHLLGLGVSRLSKLLNINTGNLSVYLRSGREIKGLDSVLEKRKQEILDLKYECMKMITRL